MRTEFAKPGGDEDLLTRTETARKLRLIISILDGWRLLGTGPVYRKLNGGVRYHPADIQAFINQRARISTGRAA